MCLLISKQDKTKETHINKLNPRDQQKVYKCFKKTFMYKENTWISLWEQIWNISPLRNPCIFSIKGKGRKCIVYQIKKIKNVYY